MLLFKALSSKTRLKMLKLLTKQNYHVSGLAKVLEISVPVAAKHVRILEDAGLVHSKTFGRTHVLSLDREKLYEAAETNHSSSNINTSSMFEFKTFAIS